MSFNGITHTVESHFIIASWLTHYWPMCGFFFFLNHKWFAQVRKRQWQPHGCRQNANSTPQLYAVECCGRLIKMQLCPLNNTPRMNYGFHPSLQLTPRKKPVWGCDKLSMCWRDTNQLHGNNPTRERAPHPFIPPFKLQSRGGGGKCSRNRAANMVVLHPLVHFPPHLHGHTPALHGRETVAHGAVAAIGRGLGNVRLRQISPHGRRFLWLHTWREDDT